jgi:hypothetical protein
VHGALVCGDTSAPARRETARKRAAIETLLRERFERAVREGDLPKKARPSELARFVMTLTHGMAVQAADGATREELQRVAEMALLAWPTE